MSVDPINIILVFIISTLIYIFYVYIKYTKDKKKYDYIDKTDNWWYQFIDWESNNSDSEEDFSEKNQNKEN